MSYGGISDDDSIDGDGRSYSSYEMEQLLTEKLALLEKEKQLRDGLGYRYAHKFYKFQREFIESTNKMNLLVAANQLGKSSSGIMRMCEKMFTTDAERIAIWVTNISQAKTNWCYGISILILQQLRQRL